VKYALKPLQITMEYYIAQLSKHPLKSCNVIH